MTAPAESEQSDQPEPPRRRLVVLCGPPGTGKTTIATALAERLTGRGSSVRVLHSDDFRRHPYDRMFRIVRETDGPAPDYWLLDGTFFRHEWQAQVRSLGDSLLVRLVASLDTCLDRNRHRKASIDEEGVRRMHRAFEEPNADLVVDTEVTGVGETVDLILDALDVRGWP